MEFDDSTTVTVVERCPREGRIRLPGERFCEECGYDYEAPASTDDVDGVATWVVRIEADHEYWARCSPGDVAFPSRFEAREQALEGPDLLVGRRNVARRIEPDIDLGGPTEDPAVSRRHARLVRDGAEYQIIDLHSANGTWLNDSSEPLAPDTPVTLRAGDRVHLGAWTTLLICRGAPPVPDLPDSVG
jgi:hypothetical protein